VRVRVSKSKSKEFQEKLWKFKINKSRKRDPPLENTIEEATETTLKSGQPRGRAAIHTYVYQISVSFYGKSNNNVCGWVDNLCISMGKGVLPCVQCVCKSERACWLDLNYFEAFYLRFTFYLFRKLSRRQDTWLGKKTNKRLATSLTRQQQRQ